MVNASSYVYVKPTQHLKFLLHLDKFSVVQIWVSCHIISHMIMSHSSCFKIDLNNIDI